MERKFGLAAGYVLRFENWSRYQFDSRSDLMRMQAVFQKEGCLVIGISISGESEDVCYLLEESKKRGADTILITGKNKDDYEGYL